MKTKIALSILLCTAAASTARADKPTELVIVNASSSQGALSWISGDGKWTRYADLEPGHTYRQPTFVGHRWAVTFPREMSPGLFLTAPDRARTEWRILSTHE